LSDRERIRASDVPGEPLLTTGEMARRAESTLRTVRFYEEEGLIRSVPRGEGGQRYFEPQELAKLALALDLREAGLSVHDIRTLFGLKSGCSTPAEASRRMAETLESQIGELQQKIDKLRSLREELACMVSSLAECGT
jgi:DNA-binding transcriptional MerR regulator